MTAKEPKRPTVASLKKVTPANLARLGAERLAEILADVAASRPELKRRLRMELAAEQGSEHLLAEIDRRLSSLEASRSRISWRQRAAVLRDLQGVLGLITGRLAELDRAAARDRLFVFLRLPRRLRSRMRDKHGEMAAVFAGAARELSPLVGDEAAPALAAAIADDPSDWAEWLPAALEGQPPELAESVLRRLGDHPEPSASWMRSLRVLADAAGNVDAYRATFTPSALRTPHGAAEVAQRLLAAGRTEEAGEILKAAAPGGRIAGHDVEWESAWIDYLDASGQGEAAQAARWSAFERTLSLDRAKAYVGRLDGFDDVEAEQRAFAHAAGYRHFESGLRLLIEWPALPEADRMIRERADEAAVSPELAELWAARLRARFPQAAHLLLRKSAAAAFKRRDFAACDRLTAEADSIPL